MLPIYQGIFNRACLCLSIRHAWVKEKNFYLYSFHVFTFSRFHVFTVGLQGPSVLRTDPSIFSHACLSMNYVCLSIPHAWLKKKLVYSIYTVFTFSRFHVFTVSRFHVFTCSRFHSEAAGAPL